MSRLQRDMEQLRKYKSNFVFYPVSSRRCVLARISHGNIETLPLSGHAIWPIKERNITSRRFSFTFHLDFQPLLTGLINLCPESLDASLLSGELCERREIDKKKGGQKIKCPMKYRIVFDMKTLSVVHTGREFMRT